MNNQEYLSPPQYEELSPDDQPPAYIGIKLTHEEIKEVYRMRLELEEGSNIPKPKPRKRKNPVVAIGKLLMEGSAQSIIWAGIGIVSLCTNKLST